MNATIGLWFLLFGFFRGSRVQEGVIEVLGVELLRVQRPRDLGAEGLSWLQLHVGDSMSARV